MSTGRIEAFSDGVIAIIITIMVLELRAPHDTNLGGLRPLVPVFASYVMSFIYVGIYWNNHHHLLHVTQHIDGRALWANRHLLFWLSLIPFVTAWMGENHFAQWPSHSMALYFSQPPSLTPSWYAYYSQRQAMNSSPPLWDLISKARSRW